MGGADSPETRNAVTECDRLGAAAENAQFRVRLLAADVMLAALASAAFDAIGPIRSASTRADLTAREEELRDALDAFIAAAAVQTIGPRDPDTPTHLGVNWRRRGGDGPELAVRRDYGGSTGRDPPPRLLSHQLQTDQLIPSEHFSEASDTQPSGPAAKAPTGTGAVIQNSSEPDYFDLPAAGRTVNRRGPISLLWK
ncbi:hypothetical protein GCM10018779_59140 [Streptomyces griseocarneus]|nr:hypothetical protein GCM10018779_59140 [Streptomyces griseocarneus]